MKKIAIAAAVLLCCAALAGCGGNKDSGSSAVDSAVTESASLTPAEKTQKVLDTVTHPELVEVTEDRLSGYYGIDSSKVTEFSAYICGSGAMPDEFGVFIAADEDAAAEIETALNDRIASQNKTFVDYTIDEMYKFDDSFVIKSGTMVCYAVCADNASAQEIFKG